MRISPSIMGLIYCVLVSLWTLVNAGISYAFNKINHVLICRLESLLYITLSHSTFQFLMMWIDTWLQGHLNSWYYALSTIKICALIIASFWSVHISFYGAFWKFLQSSLAWFWQCNSHRNALLYTFILEDRLLGLDNLLYLDGVLFL